MDIIGLGEAMVEFNQINIGNDYATGFGRLFGRGHLVRRALVQTDQARDVRPRLWP